jgi:hypothetical protein
MGRCLDGGKGRGRRRNEGRLEEGWWRTGLVEHQVAPAAVAHEPPAPHKHVKHTRHMSTLNELQ